MSIAIKLDRVALRALIEGDPDFKLELQRSVLAEVVENLFQKDIRKILEIGDKAFLRSIAEAASENETIMASIYEQLDKMLVERSSDGYWKKRVVLSKELQGIVDEAVAEARQRVSLTVSGQLAEQAKSSIEKFLESDGLEERVNKRVARLTEEHINAEVDRQVKDRLAKIAEGIKA